MIKKKELISVPPIFRILGHLIKKSVHEVERRNLGR